MREDLAEVRALLTRGADVNAAQGDGMTALHWAAERGHAELTTVLLGAGARLSATTRLGRYTPLHLAARRGHEAAALALIAAGADVVGNDVDRRVAAALGGGVRQPRDRSRPCSTAGAAVDVKEAAVGSDAADVRGRRRSHRGRQGARRRAAPTLGAAGKVVDLSARNREDGAESRARNQRVAATAA